MFAKSLLLTHTLWGLLCRTSFPFPRTMISRTFLVSDVVLQVVSKTLDNPVLSYLCSSTLLHFYYKIMLVFLNSQYFLIKVLVTTNTS